jgi:hypothetical protein
MSDEDQTTHVSALVNEALSPKQKAEADKHLADTAQEREAYAEKLRQERERKRLLFQTAGRGV